MISLTHLTIYKRFNGDSDGCDRAGTEHEKSIMRDSWELIESLIQDIRLVERGLASESYANLVGEKLKESCDNVGTIHALKELAKSND